MPIIIKDGITYKNIPKTEYYIDADGTCLTLLPLALRKDDRYQLRKNNTRVYRTKDQLRALYKKL